MNERMSCEIRRKEENARNRATCAQEFPLTEITPRSRPNPTFSLGLAPTGNLRLEVDHLSPSHPCFFVVLVVIIVVEHGSYHHHL